MKLFVATIIFLFTFSGVFGQITFSDVIAPQSELLMNCDSSRLVLCLKKNENKLTSQQLEDVEFYMKHNLEKILTTKKVKLFILHYHYSNFVPNYSSVNIKISQIEDIASKYGIPQKKIKVIIEPIMDSNYIHKCEVEGLVLITDEGAF